jgi:twitching motility protein PilJ
MTEPSVPISGNNSNEDDFLSAILAAADLESSGDLAGAAALYQQVAAADSGSYKAIAEKALETLSSSMSSANSSIPDLPTLNPDLKDVKDLKEPKSLSLINWFKNAPVGQKQLMTLIASELLSLALVATGAYLIGRSLFNQLRDQARSEVSVMEINYNIKINQMGFGFRGQSDNPAIINAATAHAQGLPIAPENRAQVRGILKNEVKARVIEYATLVGTDRKILVNANRDRTGEEFDPSGLVTAVLQNPTQIKASAIVTAADLGKEAPPLPAGFKLQDTLIRYTATPVKGANGKVLGVLISGDIVDAKLPIVENSLKALAKPGEDDNKNIQGGYNAIYRQSNPKSTGEFRLATAIAQANQELPQSGIDLPPEANDLLRQAATIGNGKTVSARLIINNQSYTVAARALPDRIVETRQKPVLAYSQNPSAILVRGTPETSTTKLLQDTWFLLGISSLFVIIIDLVLARILAKLVAQPIRALTPIARAFANGDRRSRAKVLAIDEIGELSNSFNIMADSITASELALEERSRQEAEKAETQRSENEKLQREVINLLLEIEGAQRGDLTVQAQVTESGLGSVADAFNATIRRLRQLVEQVQSASTQVNQLVHSTEATVQEFAKSSLLQSEEITYAVLVSEQNSVAIQQVSKSAQDAAEVARLGLTTAKEGDAKIDQTVVSMQNIRATVAAASKKMKQLAESSQEISQIVAIITNISEKTNLLAFNASIEAARAGENGQGFRIVADEVRRLADRVTDAAKEIQLLVTNIQQETSEALQVMETGTSEVVLGTKLVGEAKDTLRSLAEVSQNIDQYLQVISQSTVSQSATSQQVNQIMAEINAIAQKTTSDTTSVVSTLEELSAVANNLQDSVAQFQLEAK